MTYYETIRKRCEMVIKLARRQYLETMCKTCQHQLLCLDTCLHDYTHDIMTLHT